MDKVKGATWIHYETLYDPNLAKTLRDLIRKARRADKDHDYMVSLLADRNENEIRLCKAIQVRERLLAERDAQIVSLQARLPR